MKPPARVMRPISSLRIRRILAHPTLMKRPVIFSGGRYGAGWGDGLQALLLGKGG